MKNTSDHFFFFLREKMDRGGNLSCRLSPEHYHNDTLSARSELVEVGDSDQSAPSPIEDAGEYELRE